MMEAGAALVGALIDAGVDTAFTVPGESFLAVLEALRLNRNRVRLVSVRQEGGGTLAANAYGAIRGAPAAVFVSRGPGATNASIGLHTAHQDSVPMVLFIGQVRSRMRGREAFQEIDPHSAFASMSKAVLEPKDAAEMAKMARMAVEISVSGRPGPVVVVMPRDFGEVDVAPAPEEGIVQRMDVTAEAAALEDLAQALNAAERPLILAGELARQPAARDALRGFVEASGAPMICGYRCQDVLNNTHAGYAGHLEINPVVYQDKLVQESDFICVVGSRLDGITSREEGMIAADRDWAHIHPDPAVLARFGASHRVLADIAPTLAVVTDALDRPSTSRLAWRDAAHDAFIAFSKVGSYPVHGEVDVSVVAAQAREMLPDNAVVVTDAGSSARWIHRFFHYRDALTQGGTACGAMGAGVPGAIGAALATNDGRPIVVFAGDGSFLMSGQELSTAARERLPIKVVVCDNNVHGSILKGQHDKYGQDHAFGTIMDSPDFSKLAEGYGAAAWSVKATAEWRPAFAAALAHDGPALIHLHMDPRDIAPYGGEKDAV
ncbi:MAG: thiamine pyrophosphate-binding protein [Alphaproteobacteria bacterium]|nr:thiamine pyrophosphate-binding protein [Alphaproteobacteria bacterium]